MTKHFDPSPQRDVLADRFRNRGAETKPAPAAKPTAPAGPAMTTRSWYVTQDVAEAFTSAADDLLRTVPGLSKAEALIALMEYAVAGRTAVARRLLEDRHPPLDVQASADSAS